jgi:hypothetical protein
MFKKILYCIVSTVICGANLYGQSPRVDNDQLNQNNALTNIDLRSEFGPITDQGDIGFCGAYATADMLSFWLNNKTEFKNTIKDTRTKENMVSGLGVALVYNSDSGRRSDLLSKNEDVVKDAKKMIADAGGDSQKALAQAQKKADELQKEIDDATASNKTTILQQFAALANQNQQTVPGPNTPSVALSQITVDKNKSIPTKQDELNHTNDIINTLSPHSPDSPSTEPEAIPFHTPNKICFEKDIPTPSKQENTDNPCNASSQLRELFGDLNKLKINPNDKAATISSINGIFPKAKKRYLEKLIKKFSKKPDFDILHRLTDKSCKNITAIMSKNYPSPAPPTVARINHANIDELFTVIDERLKMGEPVYIAYDARLYFSPDDDSSSLDAISQSLLHSHASTIVGRWYDFTSNESLYIIRNVWGAGACECFQKAYVYTLSSLNNDTAAILYSSPVINQNKDYSDLAIRLYGANKEQYDSEVPFRCDKGYFLVKKSVLGKYLQKIDYYTPVEKLPKQQKLPEPPKNVNVF